MVTGAVSLEIVLFDTRTNGKMDGFEMLKWMDLRVSTICTLFDQCDI